MKAKDAAEAEMNGGNLECESAPRFTGRRHAATCRKAAQPLPPES